MPSIVSGDAKSCTCGKAGGLICDQRKADWPTYAGIKLLPPPRSGHASSARDCVSMMSLRERVRDEIRCSLPNLLANWAMTVRAVRLIRYLTDGPQQVMCDDCITLGCRRGLDQDNRQREALL